MKKTLTDVEIFYVERKVAEGTSVEDVAKTLGVSVELVEKHKPKVDAAETKTLQSFVRNQERGVVAITQAASEHGESIIPVTPKPNPNITTTKRQV